jgi:hypothetical protein
MSLGVVRYCTSEGGSGYIANSALPWLSSFQVGGCSGMGGLGDDFDSTCLQIQCGAISQSQAGMDTIMACARAGHVGVRSCLDPLCAPWCAKHPSEAGSPVLLRSDVVAPMPSITSSAREGCEKVVQSGCGSGDLGGWIESNPWLAAGLALAAGYVLFGGRG